MVALVRATTFLNNQTPRENQLKGRTESLEELFEKVEGIAGLRQCRGSEAEGSYTMRNVPSKAGEAKAGEELGSKDWGRVAKQRLAKSLYNAVGEL